MEGLANIPLLNADIVTGVAIMLLFVHFMSLGFTSMLIAHVTLGLPYIILNVMPRFQQLDKNVYEAAQDLGASADVYKRQVTMQLTEWLTKLSRVWN